MNYYSITWLAEFSLTKNDSACFTETNATTPRKIRPTLRLNAYHKSQQFFRMGATLDNSYHELYVMTFGPSSYT